MRGGKMVRGRKFDRTVVKKCPRCELQIPVACKYCSCGHQFCTRARLSTDKPTVEAEDKEPEEVVTKRRRTERTRRMRPDFFNPLELDTRVRKPRQRKESGTSVASSSDSPKKKRGRPKSTDKVEITERQEKPEKAETRPPPPEEDMFANIPPEKAFQFSIILAELNRKMVTQHFNPT